MSLLLSLFSTFIRTLIRGLAIKTFFNSMVAAWIGIGPISFVAACGIALLAFVVAENDSANIALVANILEPSSEEKYRVPWSWLYLIMIDLLLLAICWAISQFVIFFF